MVVAFGSVLLVELTGRNMEEAWKHHGRCRGGSLRAGTVVDLRTRHAARGELLGHWLPQSLCLMTLWRDAMISRDVQEFK